jgi:hypothetical protein
MRDPKCWHKNSDPPKDRKLQIVRFAFLFRQVSFWHSSRSCQIGITESASDGRGEHPSRSDLRAAGHSGERTSGTTPAATQTSDRYSFSTRWVRAWSSLFAQSLDRASCRAWGRLERIGTGVAIIGCNLLSNTNLSGVTATASSLTRLG